MPQRNRRVFVSFDFDNDKALKDLIVGQARNSDSPFDISDWSLKEASKEADWEKDAKAKITAVDTVVVMAGEKTDKASGVLKEVKIANDLNKGVFQVIGYSNKTCPNVPGAGKRYNWTWDNLKALLGKVTY
jgi:hypothetical protein